MELLHVKLPVAGVQASRDRYRRPVLHGHHGDVVAVHDPDGIEIRLCTTDPPER